MFDFHFFFITSTNASFNDVEHSNFFMKTCENFEETDQHCQPKKWDRSHLKLIDQTIIEGTVCAPQKLSMSLKNIGQPIAHSEWKWELHKVESVQMPLQDGHVIEKVLYSPSHQKKRRLSRQVKQKQMESMCLKSIILKGLVVLKSHSLRLNICSFRTVKKRRPKGD
ncbi:amyloid fiber anchoring/assembly protein TapA [Bacillus sp. B6(2022)]|nr:amyloid fiber anchoring/assembly protein TapA [Bacillus sp. B6(2022)]